MTEMNYVTKIIEGIVERLYSIHETKEASWQEILRYVNEFRNEPDFNIVQYGNLLVYTDNIRKFYKECGYPLADDLDCDELWALYLKDVGQVVKLLLYKNEGWQCPMTIANKTFLATFK